MFSLRLLPWEYGVRNLLRRPARTLLTLSALVTVVLLIFVVVAFIRGLEVSLANSGDPNVVLVYSINAAEDIENSAIAGRTPGLLTASLDGIDRRFGVARVSPELYVGTRVIVGNRVERLFGIVRGVTHVAPLVRRKVQISEGEWPDSGEVLVGRLVAAKLGVNSADLEIGKSLRFDGRDWRISGHFTAGGSAFESELWVPLADFQGALQRQDVSLVAIALAEVAEASDVELFCKERYDLELQAMAERDYYASLQKHYRPVRMLGWLLVLLVAGAGIFAGLNTMYGAVVGRVRELATLQVVGYRRRAIGISLLQEAVLLSTSASIIAALIALTLINGAAIRFTMGAIAFRVDSVAILISCGIGLLLGAIGAIPPALKAMRYSVADALKAV